MSDNQSIDLENEQSFSILLEKLADLQSLASDVGIERLGKKSSLYKDEHDKTMDATCKEDTLKIIQETTKVARNAMTILVWGLQLLAYCSSRRSKCFSSFSSAISYIREQHGQNHVPTHLLLEWERILTLTDLFIGDKGLYCNKRIAQDMFDICMETFDWLRSISNNNK